MISKSSEKMGYYTEYNVESAEISKKICRNLNLDSTILKNGPYTEISWKIVCMLKYILSTRLPGYNTISRSGPGEPRGRQFTPLGAWPPFTHATVIDVRYSPWPGSRSWDRSLGVRGWSQSNNNSETGPTLMKVFCMPIIQSPILLGKFNFKI